MMLSIKSTNYVASNLRKMSKFHIESTAQNTVIKRHTLKLLKQPSQKRHPLYKPHGAQYPHLAKINAFRKYATITEEKTEKCRC